MPGNVLYVTALILLALSVVPPVTSVTVEAPGADPKVIEARLATLVGQPAKPELIAGALRSVEDITPGGAEVDLRGGRVHVRYTGRRRRLGRVSVVMGDGAPDDEGSWRLLRQIQTYGHPLTLVEGRRFHPYLLEVDRALVRRYCLGRGHLDAEVTAEVSEDDDGLVSVVLRARPGPRFRIGSVTVEGFPVAEYVRDALYTRPGERRRPAPWRLADDAERVRAHVCRAGHPDASVALTMTRHGAVLDVAFAVRPGPSVRVGRFEIDGAELPSEVAAGLALGAGAPFCEALLRKTEASIVAHLRDHGHPDPEVQARAVRVGPVANVQVRVHTGGAVRVARVWFEGQRVTRRRVLELLVEVEPGDIFRQSAIDSSLQSLLRSGLFRSAVARVERGGRPGERYLTFVVVEDDFVTIDVVEESMTLHNLDVAHVAPEVDLLSRGAYLRGSGQELKVYAQTDWQGFRFEDRFSQLDIVSQLAANRRVESFGSGLAETYYDGEVGVGVEVLRHQARLVPFLLYEWSDVGGEVVEGIADGSVVNVALGVEAALDVIQLDAERVRYLGLELSARYLYGTPLLGGDATLHRLRTEAVIRLPLATSRTGQHFVLMLRAGYAILEPVEGSTAPHLRPKPSIRGYEDLVLRRTVNDSGVEIGGREITETRVAVRLPLPFRRHAIAPFIDAATMSDDDDPGLANGRASTGAAYHFSFFDERLEGFVYGAYPLVDDPSEDFFGFGVDGSF